MRVSPGIIRLEFLLLIIWLAAAYLIYVPYHDEAVESKAELMRIERVIAMERDELGYISSDPTKLDESANRTIALLQALSDRIGAQELYEANKSSLPRVRLNLLLALAFLLVLPPIIAWTIKGFRSQ